MVIEYDAATFTEWYPGAIVLFLKVAASLAIAALVIGWLVAAIRNGPTTAFRMTAATLLGALDDLLRVSPRRIAALSWLAVREAIRRRVVVVFAVFIVLLLFAGWFLDPTSDYPARLYLSFVLTATSYLVLLLALFLSAMSIPEDIKSKTLHTVVTKPVRAGEIVAGRIIGFTVVGTVLLAIMAAISYTFVVRGLSHTHELKAADLKRAEKGDLRSGFTSPEQGHVHKVTVDQQGSGRVGVSQGHWHQLSASGSGEKTSYTLGRPLGRLIARVPVYGKLRFKKSDGKHAERGDNVGDEWS